MVCSRLEEASGCVCGVIGAEKFDAHFFCTLRSRLQVASMTTTTRQFDTSPAQFERREQLRARVSTPRAIKKAKEASESARVCVQRLFLGVDPVENTLEKLLAKEMQTNC